MYNRNYLQNNNRNAFVPLILGGVIGYGIGNNNKQPYYPVYPYPPYQIYYPYTVYTPYR